MYVLNHLDTSTDTHMHTHKPSHCICISHTLPLLPLRLFLSSDSGQMCQGLGECQFQRYLKFRHGPAEQTLCHAHAWMHAHAHTPPPLLPPSSCWILFPLFWEKRGLTFKRECSRPCQQGLVPAVQSRSAGTISQSYMLHHVLHVCTCLTFPCHLKRKVPLGSDKVIIWTSLRSLKIKEVTVQLHCNVGTGVVLLCCMTVSWSQCVPFLERCCAKHPPG